MPTATLHAGDELALIPPVSGGSVGDAPRTRHRRAAVTRRAGGACARSSRRRGRDVPRGDPRGGASSITRPMSRWPSGRSRRSSRAAVVRHGLCAAAAEHRIGTVPLPNRRSRRRVGAPPRRGVRRRARDHRRDQGAGADLEEGGGRVGARDDTRATSAAEPEGATRGTRARRQPARRRIRSPSPAARSAIDEAREQIRCGADPARDLTARALELRATIERPSLVRVLNATGVIVHTNLGRAPLSARGPRGRDAGGDGYSTSSSTSPVVAAAAATPTSSGCSST